MNNFLAPDLRPVEDRGMAKEKRPRAPKQKAPRDMLELRMHEPATPARVARAAHMFDRLLAALNAETDVGTTLIVENRFLKATIRTRTLRGSGAVKAVIDLIETPLKPAKKPHPARPELASELASYAREEHRFKPQLWKPSGKEPLCDLDETFAATMQAIADAPPPDSRVVKGTTYAYSKVYRVGRLEDGGPIKARINVEHRPLEVRVDEGVPADLLFEAARTGAVVRLRVAAEWLQVGESPPRVRGQVIVGVERAAAMGAGARIVALARQHQVITAEDLPAVLSSIKRERDGDD